MHTPNISLLPFDILSEIFRHTSTKKKGFTKPSNSLLMSCKRLSIMNIPIHILKYERNIVDANYEYEFYSEIKHWNNPENRCKKCNKLFSTYGKHVCSTTETFKNQYYKYSATPIILNLA